MCALSSFDIIGPDVGEGAHRLMTTKMAVAGVRYLLMFRCIGQAPFVPNACAGCSAGDRLSLTYATTMSDRTVTITLPLKSPIGDNNHSEYLLHARPGGEHPVVQMQNKQKHPVVRDGLTKRETSLKERYR